MVFTETKRKSESLLKSALHLVDFFNVTGPHTSFSNYKMASLVELGSRIHEFV